jgi:hypothetical protein
VRLVRRALLAIAAITVASGAGQVVAPRLVLRVVGGDTASDSAAHFFGIVGMFMVLFGGLLWQSLREPPAPVGVFWAGLQKLGAAGAVGLGVARGLFSSLALGVAGFDLLSGVLALWYWRRTRERR